MEAKDLYLVQCDTVSFDEYFLELRRQWIFQHGENYPPSHTADLREYFILQQRRCENPECCKISSFINVKLFFSFSWICMAVRRKLIYMFCAVGVKSLPVFRGTIRLSQLCFLYGRSSCGKLVKKQRRITKNGLFLEHLNWILYYQFETKQRKLVMRWFWIVTEVGNALDRGCGKCCRWLIILQFTVMNLFKLESSYSF